MTLTSLIVRDVSPAHTNPLIDGYQLEISHGESTITSQITAVIAKELSDIDREISWYMEKFAEEEPFAISQANKASQGIRKYASYLLEALNLDILHKNQKNMRHLVIHIITSLAISVDSLRWETLQDVSLLPQTDGLQSISVVRLMNQIHTDPVTPGATQSFHPAKQRKSRGLNILAVTARPDGATDVGHRLITKPIFKAVQEAKRPADDENITFKICRPGTFAALKAELTMMKNNGGVYRVVHLDLHGEVQENRAYSVFLSDDGGSDNVFAGALAEELVEHGVETVVLNACRSAVEGKTPESNLAKTLAHNGIHTVVGMAYNVHQYTAELFMGTFYEQMLDKNLDPFLAAQAARYRLIEDRRRQTKYATLVEVYDYLVPSIYQCGVVDVAVADLEQQNPTEFSTKQLDADSDLVGRDGELLDLETKLLLDSPVVYVDGPAGVGKSALVENAISWWTSTALITKCIRVDLTSLPDPLMNMLYMEIVHDGKKPRRNNIKKALENKENSKLLVLLDGLETEGPDKISDSNMGDLLVFCSSFKKVQSEVEKKVAKESPDIRPPRSYVVITTRSLPSKDVTHRKVSPLEGTYSLELTTRTLEEHGKALDSADWEGHVVLEQFGKLAQGNPLAQRLLLDAYCAQDLNVHQFFEKLFVEGTLEIEEHWTAKNRSIRDIRRLLQYEDDNSTMVKALFPFWRCFKLDTVEQYFNISLNTRKIIPPRYKLRIHQAMADMFGSFTNTELNLLLGPDGIVSTLREVSFEKLFKPFIDMGFIIIQLSEEGVPESEVGYYMMHPLIPLILRDPKTPGHEEAWDTGLSAIPKLFRYQTKSWPTKMLYFKKEWDAPRETANMEFYTFLSSSYLTTRMAPNYISNYLLINAASIVSKGIYRDRSRHALLATFWKSIVDRVDREIQRLKHASAARPHVVPANDWLLRLRGLLGNIRYVVDEAAENAVNQMLLTNEITKITFLMSLADYYSGHDEDKTQLYMSQVVQTYQNRTRMPKADGAVRAFLGPHIRIFSRSSVSSRANLAKSFTKEQMQVKASARKELFEDLELSGFDIGGYDGGNSVPGVGVLGLNNALLGEDEGMYVTIVKTVRKMDENPPKVREAQRLLHDALKEEKLLAPKSANLATIHRVLSEVVEEKSQEEGHWLRAQYHWREALRIEKEAGYEKAPNIKEKELLRTEMLDKEASAEANKVS